MPARGAPAASPSADRHRDYVRGLLDAVREERAFADTKASLLLATVGVALGVGAAMNGLSTPSKLTTVGAVFWWAGAAALICGVLLLVAAVYPRLRVTPPEPADGTVVNFLEVNRSRDLTDLQDALRRTAAGEFEGLSRQLRTMSRLAERKYVLIRAALWSLFIAVIGELAAGLTGRL
jgi:Family of unknown function (DUF5706)